MFEMVNYFKQFFFRTDIKSFNYKNEMHTFLLMSDCQKINMFLGCFPKSVQDVLCTPNSIVNLTKSLN